MTRPATWFVVIVAALTCGALGACGATYVQPERPPEPERGPILSVRPLSFPFEGHTVSIDAAGQLTFDGSVVGSFAETGSFTLLEANEWAHMDDAGAIHVLTDDPSQPAPTEVTFTTTDDRLLRPEGELLARLDASGQLVTALGTIPVTGITTRTRRLALFAYLVAATYADDLATPAVDEPKKPGRSGARGTE